MQSSKCGIPSRRGACAGTWHSSGWSSSSCLSRRSSSPSSTEDSSLQSPSKYSRRGVGIARLSALFLCNRFVEAVFFLDALLTFNTACYVVERDVWIVDRATIAYTYHRSGWLYIDLVSLVPWDQIRVSERLVFLRLVKLTRLAKLLRVLKASKIIERWSKRVEMSFKLRLVLKYAFVLACAMHFCACLIRVAHDLETNGGRSKQVNTYLNTKNGPDLYRSHFSSGLWAVYVDALDWAFQTLSGNTQYITTFEGVLSLVVNLVGLLFFSFLVADLTNMICNLDPVANDYKRTVDSLNDFLHRAQFPSQTRYELREYFIHSEHLFRTKFDASLIKRLSPPLQAVVAGFLLGNRVVHIPFFSYAKACALELKSGRRVLITRAAATSSASGANYEPLRPLRGLGAREAVIICSRPNVKFNIQYLDSGEVETDVDVRRIMPKNPSLGLTTEGHAGRPRELDDHHRHRPEAPTEPLHGPRRPRPTPPHAQRSDSTS